ncbi:hypothetical protein ABT095_29455 [Kitasatospora sp. NPDC002227]|uniref:hypothetical protein n=1 Tax=Kitasatospora sp. NPDC002227 TaxID=3154773 RepID=UPI0033203470
MITLITAAVGVLSSLSALWLSIADRRSRVRKDRLEESERACLSGRQEARDRERAETALAGAVDARLMSRSPGGAAGWLVAVANDGALAITDVLVRYSGAAMADPFDLQAGSRGKVEVTTAAAPPRLAELAVEFTDAGGRRWQRRLAGGLHLATLSAAGEYEWGPARLPVAPEPGVWAAPPIGGHGPRLRLPAALALLAVACLVVLLVRH